MVASKLDALRAAELTGDILQNANSAIKGAVAMSFLEPHSVSYVTAGAAKELSLADIAEIARGFTVRVECRE